MNETRQTFDTASTYSWLDPSGTPIGEFLSIEEADEFPNVDEGWVLIAFDENGEEL